VNWDSTDSTVTTLQVGCSSGLYPGKDKRFSLIQKVQASSGCHPASNSMGTGILSRLKWPGRDVDHSPPTTAKVKNEWS